MTATSDFMNAKAITLEPARIVDGTRMVLRAICRLCGVALMLAAVGLWLAPGASWEADLMLFKLLLCVIAVLAGVGFLHASASPEAPEVQIDTIRREVRLLRPASDGSAVVLQQSSFAELTRAEIDGSTVRLFDAHSALLAQISIKDRDVLRHLTAGLEDEGKLG